MADTKITALTAIGANPIIPSTFPIPMVDLTDTSMAASGTTKKVTVNQILQAGGTATLASATITGAATVGTTLGVTGVATFAAGTALLPGLTTTGDTNTGIYYPAADTFAVTTGGSERLRIDSSGNVGIGVTPNTWTSYKALQVQSASIFSTTGNDTAYGSNFYYDGAYRFRSASSDKACMYSQFGGSHQWHYTASAGTAGNVATFTQAMTLDASGNLLVGTTSNNPAGTQSQFVNEWSGGSKWGSTFNQTVSSASYYTHIAFCTNGTVRGSIDANNAAITYGTVSDYRLKEAVQPIVGGLARISALKPSTYKWKESQSDGEGFIAHELASVVPLAVIGEKDAVNEDGSIKAQQVDLSKVVPILVAAIQELTARVQTLETR